MSKEKQILGLCKLASYIKEKLSKEFDYDDVESQELQSILRKDLSCHNEVVVISLRR